MEFKITKLDNHTSIEVLEEKLDANIAPSLKSELVAPVTVSATDHNSY